MKRLLFLPLLAASLSAATFTPINPTPHSSEVDLADIVAPWEAIGFTRISDDLDLNFRVPGYGPFFVLAWEDLPQSIGDDDFNDVVLLFDSINVTFTLIATYSADTHTWGATAGVPWLDSAQSCCGTQDFTALSNPDRMVTWGRRLETSTVPEPTSVALLGAGLLGLGWLRRRAQ